MTKLNSNIRFSEFFRKLWDLLWLFEAHLHPWDAISQLFDRPSRPGRPGPDKPVKEYLKYKSARTGCISFFTSRPFGPFFHSFRTLFWLVWDLFERKCEIGNKIKDNTHRKCQLTFNQISNPPRSKLTAPPPHIDTYLEHPQICRIPLRSSLTH